MTRHPVPPIINRRIAELSALRRDQPAHPCGVIWLAKLTELNHLRDSFEAGEPGTTVLRAVKEGT